LQPLAARAPGGGLGSLRLGLERDAEAIRQRLERSFEVEPLGRHDEIERIA